MERSGGAEGQRAHPKLAEREGKARRERSARADKQHAHGTHRHASREARERERGKPAVEERARGKEAHASSRKRLTGERRGKHV
eukprot:7673087-Alexandrium_andersonii.AAC.1